MELFLCALTPDNQLTVVGVRSWQSDGHILNQVAFENGVIKWTIWYTFISLDIQTQCNWTGSQKGEVEDSIWREGSQGNTSGRFYMSRKEARAAVL